jgi:hypothetical protein
MTIGPSPELAQSEIKHQLENFEGRYREAVHNNPRITELKANIESLIKKAESKKPPYRKFAERLTVLVIALNAAESEVIASIAHNY